LVSCFAHRPLTRPAGAEAAFVLCLFSHTSGAFSGASPPTGTGGLPFLLDRRRLNVALSRARTLCVVLSSGAVLRPPAAVLADAGARRGLAFLRAFAERAWAGEVDVDLDALGVGA
jgi:hypothetical protein